MRAVLGVRHLPAPLMGQGQEPDPRHRPVHCQRRICAAKYPAPQHPHVQQPQAPHSRSGPHRKGSIPALAPKRILGPFSPPQACQLGMCVDECVWFDPCPGPSAYPPPLFFPEACQHGMCVCVCVWGFSFWYKLNVVWILYMLCWCCCVDVCVCDKQ